MLLFTSKVLSSFVISLSAAAWILTACLWVYSHFFPGHLEIMLTRQAEWQLLCTCMMLSKLVFLIKPVLKKSLSAESSLVAIHVSVYAKSLNYLLIHNLILFQLWPAVAQSCCCRYRVCFLLLTVSHTGRTKWYTGSGLQCLFTWTLHVAWKVEMLLVVISFQSFLFLAPTSKGRAIIPVFQHI